MQKAPAGIVAALTKKRSASRRKAMKEMDLSQARQEIENIDRQMAALFEKRMNCSKHIALYKKKNDLPVFDAVRERQLLDKNSGYMEDEDMTEYYREFLTAVMDISKEYQREIIADR